MIWYVDIEHEKALADPLRAPDFEQVRNYRASVCALASGLPCEPVLYQQVSWQRARAQNLQAIAISGNTTDWAEYDFAAFEPLFELVRSGQIPTIAFCGGHQLLGLLYGAACDAIRPLHPGEADPGGFALGWYKEVGFQPVQVLKEDALFEGLGSHPVFFESHYWEIKQTPAEFELLASTADVPVQCIKHRQHLVYGTQFHPEAYSPEYPDGLALLRNFFQLGIKK